MNRVPLLAIVALLLAVLLGCTSAPTRTEAPQTCTAPDGVSFITDEDVARVNAQYAKIVRELNEANRKLRNGCT